MKKICLVNGCSAVSLNRGWCSKHYQRWLHHGDPLLTTRTPPGEPETFLREVAIKYEGDDCVIWPYAVNPAGYGKLTVNGWPVQASRVVCEAVHGPAPSPEYEAAHSCGKGHTGCVAPRHLHWATPSQNQMERLDHGTDNRGEKHPLVKLTEMQVREIYSLKGTESNRALGARFGVHPSHIGLIQRGKTWKSLDLRTGAHKQKEQAA